MELKLGAQILLVFVVRVVRNTRDLVQSQIFLYDVSAPNDHHYIGYKIYQAPFHAASQYLDAGRPQIGYLRKYRSQILSILQHVSER